MERRFVKEDFRELFRRNIVAFRDCTPTFQIFFMSFEELSGLGLYCRDLATPKALCCFVDFRIFITRVLT
jgi:hypothetical protein